MKTRITRLLIVSFLAILTVLLITPSKILAETPKGTLKGVYTSALLVIATFWKAIGINVEMILFDRAGWMARRAGGQMKGAIFNDNVGTPTISARLGYLFGPQSCGNYPDIQALWDEYSKSFDSKVKKDILARIQRMIHDRTMFIPLVKSTTPSAFGPRVKGDVFKIREPYPIWYPCPMEDLELNE